MNNQKSKKQFREANRLGFCGTLSNRLSTINSISCFLIIKNMRVFCSKVLNFSKNLLQNIAIIGLESRYFHV
jgi:hypothetical protein